MNIYETTHRAKCPNGQLMDTYEITIRSAQTIYVEDIIAMLKSMPSTIFQEDMATHIRATLGAETTVVGWHHGIKITSFRP